MIFLTLADLVYIGRRATGAEIVIRDLGLLESALARPRASAFGADAYPTLETKAAALAHSLARNHGLVDGNKRLTLAATIAFLGVNGRRLTFSNDEAYDFIVGLASGLFDDVTVIAGVLAQNSEDR